QAVVKTYLERVVPYVTSPDTRDECISDLVKWQKNVVNAGGDEETVRQLIEAYGFYDSTQSAEVISGGEFAEQLTAQAEFLVSAGTLEGVPDIDTMIDGSFVGA